MSKEKTKILEDTLKYLNYYNKYNNYSIYKSEVKDSDNIIDFNEFSDEESFYTVFKEDENPVPAVLESIALSAKKDLKETNEEDIPVVTVNNPDNKWKDCLTLESFANAISDCKLCSQLSETRTNLVFGYGNPKAEIVVVGEAPGAEEDKQGKPFVGSAGKLLTDILKAINFDREDIYICNILKCRPPENRNPLPEEIVNCEPHLYKQLDLIKPKLILALGTFAAQTLLKSKDPLGKLRGKFYTYNGIKMMVTYHPAALLRNPNWKRPTWEDVKLFRKEFDLIKEG